MKKFKWQILFLIFFILLNSVLYYLAFPSWAFIVLACFFVFSHGLYINESQKTYGSFKSGEKEQSLTQSMTDIYLKELQVAQRVQQGLLSFENPNLPGINIVKRCDPARSVGGDFYTFVNKDIRTLAQKPKIPGVIEYVDSRESYLGVAIGDVAGHGVSSALVMALTSGLMGEIGKTTKSPSDLLKIANNNILRYIENSQISYVTAFYCVLNIPRRKLLYSSAGHVPALLVHKDSKMEVLDAEGVVLGMYEDEKYEEKEITTSPGDRLFLYTDGILEARNPSGELFGFERFQAFIQKNINKPIDEIKELIFEEVSLFSASKEAKDDQTLVIIEVD
jgi:phosphoserine phosphatase RsbU/P